MRTAPETDGGGVGYCIIIPARLASSRLERKLLRRVGGKTIIEHTWRRARQSSADRVVIATDAEEIADEARGFGAETRMTAPELDSGTARVRAAADDLGLKDGQLIINVQADEPLIDPALIDELAGFAAERAGDAIATIACPRSGRAAGEDKASVKLVCDKEGRALYFSRSPIPWQADSPDFLVHMGIYAYKLEYLRRFVGYPPSPLEASESLEQLRALWHGDSIAVLSREAPCHIGIDTIDDLRRFEQFWTNNQQEEL